MRADRLRALLLNLPTRTVRVGECDEWQGNVSPNGYPRVWIDRRLVMVHRVVRAQADGVAYDEMHQVHHECRNRRCIRLEHLTPLSPESHARLHHGGRTHCDRGHSLEDAYVRPDSRTRICRVCHRSRAAGYLEGIKARNAAKRAPRPCCICGAPFAPSRNSTARYCGQKCRMTRFLAERAKQRGIEC